MANNIITSNEIAIKELEKIHLAMGKVQDIISNEIHLILIEDSDNYYETLYSQYTKFAEAVESFADLCHVTYWKFVTNNKDADVKIQTHSEYRDLNK